MSQNGVVIDQAIETAVENVQILHSLVEARSVILQEELFHVIFEQVLLLQEKGKEKG